MRRWQRLCGSVPTRRWPHLAAQGGGLEVIVDRARKLAANRVPLLICGEHGVDKEGLARALIQDVMPDDVAANMLDAAHDIAPQEFAETLKKVRFLSEYPIGKLPPVLVLLNADRLGPDQQGQLKDFLQATERAIRHASDRMRPLLIFSVERDWQALREDASMDPALLYLMGEAIVEVPPLRDRALGKVLDGLLKQEFDSRFDLSEPARQALLDYDWPGNLRELRAVLREAAICGNGYRINLVDLPPRLLRNGRQLGPGISASNFSMRWTVPDGTSPRPRAYSARAGDRQPMDRERGRQTIAERRLAGSGV